MFRQQGMKEELILYKSIQYHSALAKALCMYVSSLRLFHNVQEATAFFVEVRNA
jgi:hypothetical protein